MGFHQTIAEGKLGRDVEVRETQGGTKVGNFSVAVSYRKKVSGEWTNATKWYNCTVFNKLAENCAQYLSKGSGALVVGHEEDETWTDKEGKERTSVKLIAHTVQFIGGGGDKQEAKQDNQNQGHDSDLPF